MTATLSKSARIITILRRGPITQTELATLFGVTRETVASYVRELGELVETRRTNQVRYRLTGDIARVDAYLTSLRKPKPNGRAETAKVALTRHVHILADDEAFVPKMHRGLPHRDALVAAFFGEARA